MDNWFIDYHHALLLRLLVLGALVVVTSGLSVLARALWHRGNRIVRYLPPRAGTDVGYACHPVRNERATQSLPLVR